MPQLSQIGEIYASQLFWLAIVFALIYFGIGKAMVPKIERTVDDRNGRIDGDLVAAETARTAATELGRTCDRELETARSGAVRAAADAKAAAAAATEARIKADDAAAAERLDAAAARIRDASGAALREIEATTVDIVEQIVCKLSGTAVDRAAIDRQVRAQLAHG